MRCVPQPGSRGSHGCGDKPFGAEAAVDQLLDVRAARRELERRARRRVGPAVVVMPAVAVHAELGDDVAGLVVGGSSFIVNSSRMKTWRARRRRRVIDATGGDSVDVDGRRRCCRSSTLRVVAGAIEPRSCPPRRSACACPAMRARLRRQWHAQADSPRPRQVLPSSRHAIRRALPQRVSDVRLDVDDVRAADRPRGLRRFRDHGGDSAVRRMRRRSALDRPRSRRRQRGLRESPDRARTASDRRP